LVDLRNSNKHLVVGVVILFLGLILLLDQIGILDAGRIFMFWPLALIVFGYYRFTHTHNLSGRFWGGFCFLLGVSLQAEELGYGHIRFDTIWPVLLICAGILLILKRYEGRGDWDDSHPGPPPTDGPTIDVPPVPPTPPPPVDTAPGGSWPPGAATNPPPKPSVDPATAAAGMQPPHPSAEPGQPATSTPPSGQTGTPGSFHFGSRWHGHSDFAGDSANRQRSHDENWNDFERNMRDFGRKMDEFGERVHRQWSNPGNYSQTGAPRLNEVNIFWGGRRRFVTRNFSGGDVVAIFGGYEIDLTEADMQGNQVSIDIVNIFGGGEIRVPRNWEVVMDTVGIFGGCGDRTYHPDVPPPGATNPDGSPAARPKKLIIKGVAIFGGLTVKN
jgi:predicted membrane protein